MKNNSRISSYFCYLIGESPERTSRYHTSTINRIKAFAIAIHIPIVIWAIIGYLLSSSVFKISENQSFIISLGCAAMIYFIERLVISAPKSWLINLGRIIIGIVISILGSSAIDLVIFEREIIEQLQISKKASIETTFNKQIAEQKVLVLQKKEDWIKSLDSANCEANGTCGSKVRSTGPVYKELARQANFFRNEYISAEEKLNEYLKEKNSAMDNLDSYADLANNSGLLSRIQSLHEYISNNKWALMAWILFFTLVFFFEMMVVFCKLIFKDTVDDEIERIREVISQKKAQDYMEAVTNPAAAVLAKI